MISHIKMPKMGGRLRRHGYHWSMRPMEEAQMVGEENPLRPSAEEHTRGTRGAPPKAQGCKMEFWYAAGRSGTGGNATRPPVPPRRLNPITPEA